MAELTEEDLKNMSPEQIAELQKQNCIFCHIVSGRVSSKKIYEDDLCIAVLDINPANPGHVLLLPRQHYAVMPQIPEEIIGHMFMVAKGISHACLRAFKAEGTNIFVANGVAAGQRAQHFMIHVIPRKEGDGLEVFKIPHKEMDSDQLTQVRTVLKKRVGELLGVAGSVPLVVGKEVTDSKTETIKEKNEEKEKSDEELSEIEKQAQQELIQEELQSREDKSEESESSKTIQEEIESEISVQENSEHVVESLVDEEQLLKDVLAGSKKEKDNQSENKNKNQSDDENDEDPKTDKNENDSESSDDSDSDDSDNGDVDLDKIANLFG